MKPYHRKWSFWLGIAASCVTAGVAAYITPKQLGMPEYVCWLAFGAAVGTTVAIKFENPRGKS